MDLLRIAEEGARMVQQGFTDPNDDWAPVLLYQNYDGKLGAALIEIDDKEYTARAIESFLKKSKAVAAAFVVSAWMVTREKWDNFPDRPSLEPDRQECLVINFVSDEICTTTIAKIERLEDAPPKLGEFEVSGEGFDVSGRFTDAMRKGIG